MEESPEVLINKTKFLGKKLKTWKDGEFYGFKGIRYAAAPIGDLRFKDPIPYEYQDGEYDAKEDGHDCPSIYATNPSEDCLNLNIYTKSISKLSLKPVIVFIHPGGLYVGSSLSSFIGPEYLMEKNIVLVTFNYRLGTFGFLNLGTQHYPGNAGFKDQVLALRWVQQHILNFGGNPNNITVMGYSAGALSICLHMVSPMSKNLFHRAIIMSGSVPPQLDIPNEHQRNLALRQVQILGATNIKDENQTNEIVEFLMKKSSAEISMTLRKMFDFGKDNPLYLWLPIIEMDFGQERFLIDNPYKLIKNGNFMKIPILIGFTSQEFGQSAYDILSNDVLLNEFNQKFLQLSPICFMYGSKKLNKDQITKRIYEKLLMQQPPNQQQKQHHEQMNLDQQNLEHPEQDKNNKKDLSTAAAAVINHANIDSNSFIPLCDIFSDTIVRYGASEYTYHISKYLDDIYRYKFIYKGRYTNFNGSYKLNGAEHMDDLWYLFKMNQNFLPTDPESNLIDMMVEFFTSFAIGNGFNIGNDWKLKTKKFVEISENGIDIKVDDKNWFDAEFYQEIFNIS